MPTEEGADLEAELLADSGYAERGCQVCRWLTDRDDVAAWDRVFLNPQISVAAITRKLKSLGFPYSNPVRTHRQEKHRVG